MQSFLRLSSLENIPSPKQLQESDSMCKGIKVSYSLQFRSLSLETDHTKLSKAHTHSKQPCCLRGEHMFLPCAHAVADS